MEVGSCNDAEIQAVLSALWSAADVHGCFGLRDREPEEQDPVPCTELAAYGFEMYLAEKREALALAPDDPVADLYRGWDLHVGFGVRHPAFYMFMYGTVQRGRHPRRRTRPTPCW